MPIWPLISPVLRYAIANVDFRALYDRLSELRVRRVPRTRAHVADALNALRPPGRAAWTPQSLFLFIAAFAKVELADGAQQQIEWIREPQTVAHYILRGVPPQEREELRAMLLDECVEVFETLGAIAPQARCNTGAPERHALEILPDSEAYPDSRFAEAIRATASLGPKLYAAAAHRLVVERNRMRDRKIAALLADALLSGGLSTNECRNLLLVHGILANDVDHVLRSL